MDLQHVNIKIPVEADSKVDTTRVIELFHDWIRQQSFAELLIDVADYCHVPTGPHAFLAGLEADYSLEYTGSRYLLRYNRKAAADGSNEDRLLQAFQSAANACCLLEADASLKFSRDEFEISINDRALAPNTSETFDHCKSELEAFVEKAIGHSNFSLAHQGDARSLFTVSINVSEPFDLAALAKIAS